MKKYGRILVVAVLCVGALLMLSVYQHQKQENADVYTRLADTYEKTEEQQTQDAGSAEETEQAVDIPIDFAALQQENPDIYAWIRIPGTSVDYPILQSDGADQSYYLNHTVDHEEGFPGSIYTEMVTQRTFRMPTL